MRRYTQKIKVITHIGVNEIVNEITLTTMADDILEAKKNLFKMEKDAYTTTTPLSKIQCEDE